MDILRNGTIKMIKFLNFFKRGKSKTSGNDKVLIEFKQYWEIYIVRDKYRRGSSYAAELSKKIMI
ncbi:hypothetical protein CM15mP5_2510 [bacterium]|nr:MAG: hypothetical protein CM15mP5_2510 [bacterium]